MSLDEPFTLAATEFLRGSWDFGSVKVRGRRIEVRVDSLRLQVYRPKVGNDVAVRAALLALVRYQLIDLADIRIVDRTRQLAAWMRVPLNARIAAFGRDFVYVATRDEFDIERLTRHPIPKF